MEGFVQALLDEIRLRQDYLSDKKPRTVYFGGGTPSLLGPANIKRIMDELSRFYDLSGLEEVTLEANPDDISEAFASGLRSGPVNRISLGVQSFLEKELQWMHRSHSAEQAVNSVKLLQDKGFENLSIDLIYGTPSLTDSEWEETIQQALALNVPHISAYSLTVEHGTALEKLIDRGRIRPVDDEKQAGHFGMLMEIMESKGFEHYEISSFCLPGHYAKHNSSYWKGAHYLGLGPSAHSYNGISRQWNVRDMQAWSDAIKAGTPQAETELIDERTAYNEYVMTSLRTMWGCNPEQVKYLFGEHYAHYLEKEMLPFIEQGLVTSKDKTFILTREGKLYADAIASALFMTGH